MGLSSGEVLSVLSTSMEVGVENVLEVSEVCWQRFSASSVSLTCAGGSGQRGQCVCGRGGIVGDSAAFVEG